MNTKLDNNDLQVREISIEEFDAMEGNHIFSERYESKKEVILDSFKAKSVGCKRKNALKVAIAAMAVIICSGSALAMNGEYLKKFYESKMKKMDEKYIDREFLEGKYELPIDVKTDDESDLLSFEVLQADKGEHAISFAVVVTVNHEESYEEAAYYDVLSRLTLVGMEDALDSGWGWIVTTYTDDTAQTLGLEKNQILQIMECQYDESVDLSEIERLQVSYQYVDKVQEVQGEYGMDLEMFEIDHNHVWTVEVPLQQDYEDYVVEVGKSYVIGENEIKIETIRVSPLGVDFFYKIPSYSKVSPTGYMEENDIDIMLKMMDGKKISLLRFGEEISSCYDGDTNWMQERVNFRVPMDVDQIVGIEIDGELIKIQ
ncbi:MAG: hypothetical protein IJD40_06755 [Lachnospiraceae bacterium]|nr:hypothetical protein [Lachnospiraceae bacterium]